MPYTIKTGYLNIKDENGQYIRNNTVAEQSTAEQIAEIIAKGEEVRQSIPSDYMTLNGSITTEMIAREAADNELKSAINASDSDVFELKSLNWEQGALDAATGATNGSQYRIRAKLVGPNIRKISTGSGLFFSIFAFSGATYMGEWTGNGFEKAANRLYGDFDATVLDAYAYTYWIMGGHTTNISITPSDNSLFEVYNGRVSEIESVVSEAILEAGAATWEQGGYNLTSGEPISAANRIRSTIGANVVYLTAPTTGFATILGYDGSTYKGAWNGKGFEKEACRLKGQVCVSELRKYGYILRVMCGNDDNSSIAPNDGASFVVTADKVSNLISLVDSALYPREYPIWWQRSINVTTGEISYSGYRISAHLNKYAQRINVPSNMFFTILAFAGDTYIGTWNGTTFNKSAYRFETETDVTALRSYNYVYWIMVGYDASSTSINVSAGGSVEIIVDMISTRMETDEYQYSATPNIVYQCRNVDDTRFPPESKWAVKAAAANQYDRVRCTVRKTFDGEYVLCHNQTINDYVRNSDGTELAEDVSVEGHTLAELNQYDWGIKYGAQYAEAKAPMLDDFLKYAAIFNLGVTWHAAANNEVQSNESINEQIALIDKYGLTDNLIVIAAGQKMSVLQQFVAHNPRISCYVGGEPAYFEDADNLAIIESLQTPYNKIYVQLFPWGTKPTNAFIALAKSKNWLLYDSITMSEPELCNEDMFARGYSLREVNNVYMVKDTVRNWANSIF